MFRYNTRPAFWVALGLMVCGAASSPAAGVAPVSNAPAGDAKRAAVPSPQQIEAGREQFTRVRSLATKPLGATRNVDRFFNAQSCAECHRLGGVGGAGANEHNVQLITGRTLAVPIGEANPLEYQRLAFEKMAKPSPANTTGAPLGDHLRAVGSAQFTPLGSDGVRILHRRSSLPGYEAWRKSLLGILNFKLPVDTARKADSATASLAAAAQPGAPIPSLSAVEERNTPPLFGLGLIDSIPQESLDLIATHQNESVRGRSPRLRTGGRGRFGWKAQTATLADFNAGACAAELGLRTKNFAPSEWIAERQDLPEVDGKETIPTTGIDMTHDDLVALNTFVAALPAPKQVIERRHRHEVSDGEYLFRVAGCAVCHVPDVGGVVGIYSDLLLHDVGTTGSVAYYGSPIGPQPAEYDIVQAAEIRTPPLWGVADSAPYFHDGSAPTLEAAILAHQAQGADSAQYYRGAMNEGERGKLLAFLKSLRAPLVAVAKGELR